MSDHPGEHDRERDSGQGSGGTVRVLIVDDSAFMRRAVERMLAESTAIQVVGMAINGRDAVELACRIRPDVIVLDVNMPTMDGLEALEQIMTRCPVPVLMMSTLTQEGAQVTVRALELGAVDFLDKGMAGTSMDIYSLGPILRDKVFTVAGAEVSPVLSEPLAPTAASPPEPRTPTFRPAGAEISVIAIGASTGGPRALTEIIPRLPANLDAVILIAQHMPTGFTATLAERLNERSALRVVEASDADALEAGTVLVAPGGHQMRLENEGGRMVVRISEKTSRLLYHPSVDLLFESVASAVGKRAIGVVLTGMGQDGAEGLAKLKNAGGRAIVESSRTAVIDGMPKSCRSVADLVLPLDRIASALVDYSGIRTAQSEGSG